MPFRSYANEDSASRAASQIRSDKKQTETWCQMAVPEEKINNDARDEVLNLDQLPPLALAATRLIEIASDPNLEIHQLASIIEQDPPLTARVLGLANSAYFGQSEPIFRVERAIIQVLGLNEVRSLSLLMALAGSFDTRRCSNFDPGDYWLRAVLTANVAAAIGRCAGDEARPVDALYLCGLLHNIGVLAMVHARPAEMTHVINEIGKDPSCDPIAVEQAVLGVDHKQAGEWLAFRWHLPEVVVHSLADSAAQPVPEEHAGVVEIVRAASLWTDDYVIGREVALHVPSLPEEFTVAVEQEIIGRLDRLRALAGAFTQHAPV